jgi:hypothetical protein
MCGSYCVSLPLVQAARYLIHETGIGTVAMRPQPITPTSFT